MGLKDGETIPQYRKPRKSGRFQEEHSSFFFRYIESEVLYGIQVEK